MNLPLIPPLVFIETQRGTPTPGSLGVLARMREVAGAADAVVCGPGATGLGVELGLHGADRVWACESAGVDPEQGQTLVDVFIEAVRSGGHTLVAFENSTVAAEVAAGLAVRLEAGVNWDLQDIALSHGVPVGTRLALNDTVAVNVGWRGLVALAVFRLGLFEPAAVPGMGGVTKLDVVPAPYALASAIEGRFDSAGDAADLAGAEVIIAGGRGLRDKGSLALLEDLAEALGGVVAVSMPLVDRGWYPHNRQVGQTGTKVRPRLYVACGISGQLAHRVGMDKSSYIVAINTDPTAPIFAMCDAGVVGDLHEVVPELARRVREDYPEGHPERPRDRPGQ